MTAYKSEIDPRDEFFELPLPRIGKWTLRLYCWMYKLRFNDFRLGKKHVSLIDQILEFFRIKNGSKFWIPGHYLLGLLRTIVAKTHKLYPSFPIRVLESFYGANGGTHENRVLLYRDLVVKIQKRVKFSDEKYLFYVEYSDKTTGKILLKGLFNFIGHL